MATVTVAQATDLGGLHQAFVLCVLFQLVLAAAVGKN